jgi:SSS family transporter
MSGIDWIVLSCTLLFIVAYGIWKSRVNQNIDSYLLGNKDSKWWTIGLSVMATQASAITFLSTPGQAYSDGMGFVQFYFGLPIAMVIICVTFIPIYYRLKVYTAYEYLESRFDLKTRLLAAFIFLMQRGLGAGITIFAPAIILSSILGWNLNMTILVIGIIVTVYTVLGGTRAVSQTQKLQMVIILMGMVTAFCLIISYLPDHISFSNALAVAGASGKLNTVDFTLDLESRYTFWSGMTGGIFLMLAYFGTDQSQVQRYLNGRSVRESRLGLIFNGLLKVPMQFFILLVGVMVFVFYQYNKAPIFFNQVVTEQVYQSDQANNFRGLEAEYDQVFQQKQILNASFLEARQAGNDALQSSISTQIKGTDLAEKEIRQRAREIIQQVDPSAETNDKDYVFISFILEYMPKGIIGLLLAVILSAAMSSTSAELNALASTTTVDIYKRAINGNASDKHYVIASKAFTAMWGIIALLFAMFGTLFENLIQFVNLIGSIFYGPVLGIFIAAFFIKILRSRHVFWAAIIAQIGVILCNQFTDMGFLWYNVIGCMGVILVALLFKAIDSGSGE